MAGPTGRTSGPGRRHPEASGERGAAGAVSSAGVRPPASPRRTGAPAPGLLARLPARRHRPGPPHGGGRPRAHLGRRPSARSGVAGAAAAGHAWGGHRLGTRPPFGRPPRRAGRPAIVITTKDGRRRDGVSPRAQVVDNVNAPLVNIVNVDRSARERRVGTQCLRFPPRHAPSRGHPGHAATRAAVSTLAFSRSVQEPQTRLTPPLRRAPPGQYTGIRQAHPGGLPRAPGFDAISVSFDASTAHAPPVIRRSGSGTSSWSPPDAITPRLLPDRSPRQSSANAAPGGLAPAPGGRRWRASDPPSLAQHRFW